MIKAIFIDIDNTILDFEAYVEESIRNGMEKFKIGKFEPYMLDVFHTENNKLWKRIEQGTLTLEELKKIRFNNVFSALGFDFDGTIFEKFFREYLNESAIPVPGATELLEELSKTYILCSASNGPYNQQLHRLELGNLIQYFDHHFISEKIGYSKPSDKYFSKCFGILGDIKPEECIMIGDSESADISGGNAAGMITILFDKNKINKPTAADYTVFNLTDIPKIIEQIH